MSIHHNPSEKTSQSLTSFNTMKTAAKEAAKNILGIKSSSSSDKSISEKPAKSGAHSYLSHLINVTLNIRTDVIAARVLAEGAKIIKKATNSSTKATSEKKDTDSLQKATSKSKEPVSTENPIEREADYKEVRQYYCIRFTKLKEELNTYEEELAELPEGDEKIGPYDDMITNMKDEMSNIELQIVKLDEEKLLSEKETIQEEINRLREQQQEEFAKFENAAPSSRETISLQISATDKSIHNLENSIRELDDKILTQQALRGGLEGEYLDIDRIYNSKDLQGLISEKDNLQFQLESIQKDLIEKQSLSHDITELNTQILEIEKKFTYTTILYTNLYNESLSIIENTNIQIIINKPETLEVEELKHYLMNKSNESLHIIIEQSESRINLPNTSLESFEDSEEAFDILLQDEITRNKLNNIIQACSELLEERV